MVTPNPETSEMIGGTMAPPEVKKEIKKVRSIVVDTFTAFQKNQILDKWENGKATNDD